MSSKDEIDFFEEFSKTWWYTTNSKIYPLHTMNKVRVPYVAEGYKKHNKNFKNKPINSSLKGIKILDVGCGGGIFSEGLGKLEADVTGIDPGKDLISVAEHHAKKISFLTNLKYIPITIEEHSNTFENYYDCVVSSEVVEHISGQENFLKNCIKCLKPGGSIFLTTFHKSWWSKFVGIFVYEDVFRIINQGTHHYNMFLSLNECKSILERHGCKIVDVKNCLLNPFNLKWNFTKLWPVHYFIQAVKI